MPVKIYIGKASELGLSAEQKEAMPKYNEKAQVKTVGEAARSKIMGKIKKWTS